MQTIMLHSGRTNKQSTHKCMQDHRGELMILPAQNLSQLIKIVSSVVIRKSELYLAWKPKIQIIFRWLRSQNRTKQDWTKQDQTKTFICLIRQMKVIWVVTIPSSNHAEQRSNLMDRVIIKSTIKPKAYFMLIILKI